jgi:hypothetical protein
MRSRCRPIPAPALFAAALLAVPSRCVLAQQSPSYEFIHTNDWQPGDNVSFTVRGVVVDSEPDPKPAQTPGDSFKGYVVEVSGPKGTKIRLPWAALLRMTVPPAAGMLTARLLDPKGKRVAESQIPVVQSNCPTAVTMPEPPAGNVVVPPVYQTGRPYRVVSPRGRLDGDASNTKLVAQRGSEPPVEHQPLAESPRAAIFTAPALEPGPHTFTIKEGNVFQETFRVRVLGILLDTSRIYKVGQKGTLLVAVLGAPAEKAELQTLSAHAPVISVVNKQPAVLTFVDQPQKFIRRLAEAELRDGKWILEIAVLALKRGQFEITSTVSARGYVNSGTPGPPQLFKGPDDPAAHPGPAVKPDPGGEPAGPKPPEQPGGPEGPPTNRRQREPDRICGPDITASYISELKTLRTRLRQARAEIDEMGAGTFMHKNGMRMDYWVGSTGGCPRGECVDTLTFAGLCVGNSFTNDLMYGYIGGMLSVPLETLVAGGDVQELLAQGNLSGKPARKVAGYATGYDLASEADITVENILRLLQGVFVSTGDRAAVGILGGSAGRMLAAMDMGPPRRALDLITAGCENCALCPEARGPIPNRDFPNQPWILK